LGHLSRILARRGRTERRVDKVRDEVHDKVDDEVDDKVKRKGPATPTLRLSIAGLARRLNRRAGEGPHD